MADRSDPLGYDMKYGEGLDPSGRSCSGAELVEDEILHRLMEDTLPMIGAPGGVVDFGRDVSRWVGEVTTQDRANAKAPELVMVINRSPRLDKGMTRVVITLTPQPEARYDFEIDISAQTTTGIPIAMVVGVSSQTVEKLAQGGAPP